MWKARQSQMFHLPSEVFELLSFPNEEAFIRPLRQHGILTTVSGGSRFYPPAVPWIQFQCLFLSAAVRHPENSSFSHSSPPAWTSFCALKSSYTQKRPTTSLPCGAATAWGFFSFSWSAIGTGFFS